jgi:hypothetical protein
LALAASQGQVDVLALQVDHPARGVQPHGDLRMGDLEAAQPRGQPLGAEALDGGDRQHASSVSTRSETAARSRAMASLAARARRSPAGVRATSRGRRTNRAWPSRCSRALTCQLTAAWLTPRASAARVKLFRRAAASKIRMALSGRLARLSDIRLSYA